MGSLYNLLISLGVHVGHLKQTTLSINYSYLIGTRHGVAVLDIKDVVSSLRKTISFFHQVGRLKGDLLFHITCLPDYGSNIHYFFVHLIVHQFKQRLFDEQWVFGQFGNIRHHAISLIFQLFFVQKRKFNLYVSKNYKRAMGYRSHLLRYVRGFYRKRTYNVLKKGQRSLKKHKLLNLISFYDLFVRVIFYSYFKKIKGISFEIHFSKMVKFFKFVLLFKYFRTFLIMPDVFVLTNSNKLASPVLEMLSYKIPVVGLLDSDSDPFGITYPVYSNDDNILLSIFYFKLFLNSYKWGKMKRFLS